MPPYTRGIVSLSRGAGRQPGASVHTRPRLFLSLSLSHGAQGESLVPPFTPVGTQCLVLSGILSRGEDFFCPRPYATAGGKASRGLGTAASVHPKAAAPLRAKGRGAAVQTSAIFDELGGSFGGLTEGLNGLMKGNPGEKTRTHYEAGFMGTPSRSPLDEQRPAATAITAVNPSLQSLVQPHLSCVVLVCISCSRFARVVRRRCRS